MIAKQYLNELLKTVYQEDIGSGDHSSLSTIPKNAEGKAKLLVKETGIIAGVELASYVCDYFKSKQDSLKIETLINDGEQVNVGDIVFIISGLQLDILKVERTLLNFMQRMSGIATETRKYVNELKGFKTQILDTRKTTPGLRLIEKEAVKIGGGTNHRIGLYDMIMLKDNHIDYSNGIENAIINANNYINTNVLDLKIEIETRNISEVERVLKTGKVHRIMLDNFNIEDTKKAVDLIGGRYETESSGGITLKNIKEYAKCGVDFISVGALTHHVNSLDLSLKAIKDE